MEKHVESFILSAGNFDLESPELTLKDPIELTKEQTLSTFKKVFPYMLSFKDTAGHQRIKIWKIIKIRA